MHTTAPLMLEVAANSVASALAAQEGGAGRVELCAALELGGITPSYAEIATARDRLAIPLYVLIRPRAGDFLYNDFECEVMLRDIEARSEEHTSELQSRRDLVCRLLLEKKKKKKNKTKDKDKKKKKNR